MLYSACKSEGARLIAPRTSPLCLFVGTRMRMRQVKKCRRPPGGLNPRLPSPCVDMDVSTRVTRFTCDLAFAGVGFGAACAVAEARDRTSLVLLHHRHMHMHRASSDLGVSSCSLSTEHIYARCGDVGGVRVAFVIWIGPSRRDVTRGRRSCQWALDPTLWATTNHTTHRGSHAHAHPGNGRDRPCCAPPSMLLGKPVGQSPLDKARWTKPVGQPVGH